MVEPYGYHGKAIRGGRRDIMAKQFVVRTDPTTMSVTKVVEKSTLRKWPFAVPAPVHQCSPDDGLKCGWQDSHTCDT